MNVEDVEDRLRRAIEARTSTVEPSPDALGRINDKLSDQGEPMDLSSTRTRWILGVAAAIVLVAALLAGLMLPDGDDRTEIGDTADRRTTTTEPRTTTTEPSGDPTTTTEPSGDPGTSSSTTPRSSTTTTTRPAGPSDADQSQMLWPRPSSDVRFDTPEAAARSFARYYARFQDPIVGAFRQGDSRSGEVPVQAFADGPETTVFVRQLAGDSWFVIAAQAEDVTLTSPSVGGARLRCPQHVEGTALAFEGTVQVRIDAYQLDGDRVELGSGFVTGSGSPPAGPFQGDIACQAPGAGERVEAYGILTLWTPSEAEDGRTLAITAIPIAVAAT